MSPARLSSPPVGPVTEVVDSVCVQFEAALCQGLSPRVEQWLPEQQGVRAAALVELVRLELEYRLRDGEAVRVEDYLARFPELQADPAAQLRVLAMEWKVRRAREPELSPRHYRLRFPGLTTHPLWDKLFPEPPPLTEGSQASSHSAEPIHAGAVIEQEQSNLTTLLMSGPPPSGRGDQPSLPGYTILGELGRGGMGVVYRARQQGLNRVCALKMIRAGCNAGDAERTRFLAEAEAVAAIRHPGIVQVFDFGVHHGLPYFSMELCPGGSLAGRLNGTPLSSAEAAGVLEPVARAVQAAHAAGVVHRDLKPSNILYAEDGSPKVTDFGLAKRIERDSGLTATGAILGTPSYMAPEQAAGRSDVGPAVDTYALGAVLYECLTGRPPFRAATPIDTVLEVISQEPVPPRRLNAQVPADLETICLKCLEKEPARRYASAGHLADDLARYRTGQPILARPTSLGERVVKWCRREPRTAGLLGLVLASALLGFVGVSIAWRQAETARAQLAVEAEARQRAYRAEARQRVRLERQLYFSRITLADRELQAGKPAWARQSLDRCPDALRGWEWHHLDRVLDGQPIPSWSGHSGGISCLAFDPAGRLLASSGGDGAGRLWQPDTGKSVQVLTGHDGSVNWVSFSPDGHLLATGGDDRQVLLWEATTGRRLRRLSGHDGPVSVVAFHPSGRYLASGTFPLDGPGSVWVWDLGSGTVVSRPALHRGAVTGLAWSADGVWLASASHDGSVRRTDPFAGAAGLVFRGHAGPVAAVAVSPDGRLMASAAGRLQAERPDEGEVLLWEAATGTVVHRLQGHTRRPTCVAFSPDGERLATGGWDSEVKLWDVADGQEVLTLRAHRQAVLHLGFATDGRLASGGLDGVIRVWLAARDGGRSAEKLSQKPRDRVDEKSSP